MEFDPYSIRSKKRRCQPKIKFMDIETLKIARNMPESGDRINTALYQKKLLIHKILKLSGKKVQKYRLYPKLNTA
jgi:hypothetical protein